MGTIPSGLVGAAGVHFVAAELSFRGLIALPTIRNTAGIDLLVRDPKTSGHASIQVKTSQKKVKFWPTANPKSCLRGPNCFYVFVRYLPKEGRFEAFLEDADKVAEQIAQNLESYRAKGRKDFYWWQLPRAASEQANLREKWRNWRPPASES